LQVRIVEDAGSGSGVFGGLPTDASTNAFTNASTNASNAANASTEASLSTMSASPSNNGSSSDGSSGGGNVSNWRGHSDGSTACSGIQQPTSSGVSTVSTSSMASRFASEARVVDAVCGEDFTVCLTESKKVFSWGANDYGCLGRDHENDALWHV
jgi:hypothetical protein